MRQNEWFFHRGTLTRGPWESIVDDSIRGWKYTGVRIGALADGDQLMLEQGETERIVVPLAGSFQVKLEGVGSVDLVGRASVFDGVTDVYYLGAGSAASITGVGRVAVAEASTTIKKPSRYISKAEVPVELRGAGQSSRQVHNFGTPEALDAGALLVCEVITPAGNWSSYPAHKHDEYVPGSESQLEEIYYFEVEASREFKAPREARAFGHFCTSRSPAGEIETRANVRTGDIALVPYGYHGPATAAPGYDLYYLNVMAGPGPDRVWRISDDPAHAWVRGTWEGQDIDPRLPYVE